MRQSQSGVAEKNLDSATKALKALLEFMAAAGPFGNFFFGLSTSQLWNLIEGI
jgi:hypothetical protein